MGSLTRCCARTMRRRRGLILAERGMSSVLPSPMLASHSHSSPSQPARAAEPATLHSPFDPTPSPIGRTDGRGRACPPFFSSSSAKRPVARSLARPSSKDCACRRRRAAPSTTATALPPPLARCRPTGSALLRLFCGAPGCPAAMPASWPRPNRLLLPATERGCCQPGPGDEFLCPKRVTWRREGRQILEHLSDHRSLASTSSCSALLASSLTPIVARAAAAAARAVQSEAAATSIVVDLENCRHHCLWPRPAGRPSRDSPRVAKML